MTNEAAQRLSYDDMPVELQKVLDDAFDDAREQFSIEERALAAGGLQFTDADGLATNAKAADYLVNGIIESDSHGVIFGASMTFKSFFALALAHSVATGCDFFGHKIFKTGVVLYICGEGKGALSRRIRALSLTNGGFDGNLKILESPICIDNSTNMHLLQEALNQLKPVLIVFDTFSSLAAQTDENNNSDVATALRLVRETCNFSGASSIVVHHVGKNDTGTARGASAFLANVDFSIRIERAKNSMISTVSSEKTKDGEPFTQFSVKAEAVSLGFKNQDDTEATSLILKSTNEQTQVEKALTQRQVSMLGALDKAIFEVGLDIPEMMISHFQSIEKVTHLEYFRSVAYDILGVAENSKRTVFARELNALKDSGNILIYNDFIGKRNSATQRNECETMGDTLLKQTQHTP